MGLGLTGAALGGCGAECPLSGAGGVWYTWLGIEWGTVQLPPDSGLSMHALSRGSFRVVGLKSSTLALTWGSEIPLMNHYFASLSYVWFSASE